MKRAVITGLGVVAPNGACVEQFWDNTMAGRVVITDEPLMKQIGLQCHGVGRCADFDLAEQWPGPEAAELSELGRFIQLGAGAAREAMVDSGLPGLDRGLAGGGAVFASAVGGAPEMQELYEEVTADGVPPIKPRPVPSTAYDGIFLDYLPAMLGRVYGLTGPTLTLTTGCTAGLDALGIGVDLVRHGEAPYMLVGAGECPLNGISYATLDVIGCLSRTDGPVERSSRPFDATRAGFVIAEGAAFVLVEEAEHARERGARVHAEVTGYASTSNAYHMTDLLADGESMSLTIRRALADGEVAPTSIGYINAHGSSTPQNDLFETNAFKAVFGQRAYQIPISSLKSMTGHSLASASLLALIATIGAMSRSTLPPTANYQVPDPRCDLDYVTSGPRAATVDHALVVASGFGGIHSAAVLGRADR